MTRRLTKTRLAASLTILEVVRHNQLRMAMRTKDPAQRRYLEGVADGLKMARDHLDREWLPR